MFQSQGVLGSGELGQPASSIGFEHKSRVLALSWRYLGNFSAISRVSKLLSSISLYYEIESRLQTSRSNSVANMARAKRTPAATDANADIASSKRASTNRVKSKGATKSSTVGKGNNVVAISPFACSIFVVVFLSNSCSRPPLERQRQWRTTHHLILRRRR